LTPLYSVSSSHAAAREAFLLVLVSFGWECMWAFIKHVKLFCVLLLNLDMLVLKLPGSAYQSTVFMKSWRVDAGLNNKRHLLIVWFSGFLLCIPQCCCGFCWCVTKI